MRYRPEHKARTRARILDRAARLFRRHGYAGVGIDGIMESARLTRGGFYGHFASKADLFAAVISGPHDFIERLRARPGRERKRLAAQALEIIDGYLDPENRDRVGRGCSMAALAPDVARSGPRARAVFGERLEELVEELSRGLEAPQPNDPRALAAAALCVGGLALSRAAGDAALADRLERACQAYAHEILGARRVV